MRREKRIAYEYLCKLKDNFEFEDIINELRANNWSVREYGGDETNDKIIDILGLAEFAARSSSFIYYDDEYKFIFIKKSEPAYIKRFLLLHEIGHILCGHIDPVSKLVKSDIEQEIEANDVSFYLRNFNRFYLFFFKNRGFLMLIISLVIVIAVLFLKTRSEYVDVNVFLLQFYKVAP